MSPAGAGFVPLLHAEWTKLRTVRGWVTGIAAGALMVVLVAVLAGVSTHQEGAARVPLGPDGAPVTDSFYFVHQPQDGDGSITVAVRALDTSIPTSPSELEPGIVPWAKAGLIIKEGTREGSSYAAIMVTGSHGVRMQQDFVHDAAGLPGPVTRVAPRWLRLVRSGDLVTGYASVDGTTWTRTGAARVRLGPTAQVGLFVASPPSVHGRSTRGTVSTAVFDDLRVEGRWSSGEWTGVQLGPDSPTFAGYPGTTLGSHTASNGGFTVTGAGDIAPAVRETLPAGGTVAQVLTGAFAALVAVVVVGALYVTTEHQSRLLEVTFAAEQRRPRILAAKAIVLGAVTFGTAVLGAAIAVPLGERLARANGVPIFPVSPATELRVVLGTAALVGTTSILALCAGCVLRRSEGAITAVVVLVVLPYLMMAIPFLPAGVSDGLARVTPAAAFAVQQTLVPYGQVTSIYTPYTGYYPLSPWAGFAVLVAYTVVAFVVAVTLLHRRDP